MVGLTTIAGIGLLSRSPPVTSGSMTSRDLWDT
jgi:hypothetical protein